MRKSGLLSHTVELRKHATEEITFHPCPSASHFHLHLWELNSPVVALPGQKMLMYFLHWWPWIVLLVTGSLATFEILLSHTVLSLAQINAYKNSQKIKKSFNHYGHHCRYDILKLCLVRWGASCGFHHGNKRARIQFQCWCIHLRHRKPMRTQDVLQDGLLRQSAPLKELRESLVCMEREAFSSWSWKVTIME